MAYYPTTDYLHAFHTNNIGFDIGPNKDCYSVSIYYHHDIESDVISYKAEVIRNWVYDKIPETGAVEGKKYREVLSSGTPKECLAFIDNIVKAQGYWDKHPTESFKQIFIEPVLK